jgi:hydroxymethylpyrimidine/phosphomethylpyrimidine kinase
MLRGSRVPGEMRGTGCALGAAISANLARGHSLDEAVNEAREFVRYKLAAAVEVGGMRLAY